MIKSSIVITKFKQIKTTLFNFCNNILKLNGKLNLKNIFFIANFRILRTLVLSTIIFIFFILFQACGEAHKRTSKNTNLQEKDLNEKLIKANKIYVQQESDEIDQYVHHRGWKMITTGTGLRYMITEIGNGTAAANEKQAKVNYKISLLDGTLCYSSDSTGSKTFLIGRDNVESGLHEAIQLLRVGSKAIFILPSHLAHGLIGDNSKIPPKSSVIYDIELLSIN